MRSNIIKRLMLASVVLVGLSACQTDDDNFNTVPKCEQVTMVLTAGDVQEESRTALNELRGKVDWTSDDKLTVWQMTTIVDSWFGEVDIYNDVVKKESSTADIDALGKATFTATFDKLTASDYTYYAAYPAGAANVSDTNFDDASIELPAVQNATAKSFDGAADLLIAKPIVTTKQATELSLKFKRMVSIGKMSLKGLPNGVTVSSVKFTADKVLVGSRGCDLVAGEFTNSPAVSENNRSVTVNYATPIAATDPVYFTCYPAEFAEGDSFTLQVKTNSGDTYTKSVTIPSGRQLNFVRGDISTFTVNLSGVTPYNPKPEYKVGDLYYENGVVKGIIYAVNVSASGSKWNYVVSLDEEFLQWSTENVFCNCCMTRGDWNTEDMLRNGTSPDKYPAAQWCVGHGDGWFLPSSNELNLLWDAITDGAHNFNVPKVAEFNKLLTDNGGDPFEETFYMSSNETTECLIVLVTFSETKGACLDPQKSSSFDVRAVYRFKAE